MGGSEGTHTPERRKSSISDSVSHWWLKLHRPHAEELRSSRTASITPQKQVFRLDFTQNIPPDIPYPPFVNVVGVPNFRDLGGYSCNPHGAQPSADAPQYSVRKGYAYRCSELSQITPEGNVLMADTLKIKTLFDFRSEREAANPRGHPQGVKCISVPVFKYTDITQKMAAEQLRWGTAPDTPADAGFSQGYVNWYRQIAIYGATGSFRTVFQHIRDKPDEPFVFHCSAGKDRTGVLTAIILKLCGVENSTVAWEYALTVPGMGVWEAAVEQEMVGDSMLPIRSHGGMTREEAHRLCGSRESNMLRWLDVILEKEFGGAVNYLKKYCHFNHEEVEKIVTNLIVMGEGTVKPVEVPGMEDHPQT